MADRPLRAVIVTNIPTPYRMPVYELVDAADDVQLTVVYLAERERNRSWELGGTTVRSITLRSATLSVGGRYIHFTRGVWWTLARLRPDVVVTTGFNPPQLIAFLYCVLRRVPHVVQTDGTPRSEERLTRVHSVVRRIVSARSSAFVAASDAGLALVRSWGANAERTTKSPLAVDNEAYASAAAAGRPRDVDLLFSGQLSSVKDPEFALDVAHRAAGLLDRRLTVAVLGDGPLRPAVEERARRYADRLDVEIAGFQQQADLPGRYARSKVFLFPTHWDPWGLVLNEALAAGVPAIVSPEAGSGAELIEEGVNGRVLPLDVDTWAREVVALLAARHAAAARSVVQGSVAAHTYADAAAGLRDALRIAAG